MREMELKTSRLLGLLLAGMGLLALLAIYLATLPGGVKLALSVVAAGLSAWGWRQASRLGRLRIAANGQLQALGDADEWCDVEVSGNSFVSTALIVLRYRFDGGALRKLILLPDSAPADDLRRLRVSLRWIRRTRSDTSSPDAG
jgi:toxin CptA